MPGPWEVVGEQPSTPAPSVGRRPSNPWSIVSESPSDAQISASVDAERERKYAAQPSWLRPIGRAADTIADTLTLGATRQAVGGVHRIEQGDTAKGVSDLLRAGGTAVAPYGVGRAATGLLGVGARLGARAAAIEGAKLGGEVALGAGAQYGVEEGLKAAGVSEGKSSLAGDVAGLAPLTPAVRAIGRMNRRPSAAEPKVTVTPAALDPTPGGSDPYENATRRLVDLRKSLTGEMNQRMSPEKRALMKEQYDLILKSIPMEDRRHIRAKAKRIARVEMVGGAPEHALAAGPAPSGMTPEEFVDYRFKRREGVKEWGKPRSLGEKIDLAWGKVKDRLINDWARVDEQLGNATPGEKALPPRQELQWHRQNVARADALANGAARRHGLDDKFLDSIQKAVPNGLRDFSVYLEAKRVLANDAVRKAGGKADLTGFEAWIPQYRELVAAREQTWGPFEKVIRAVAEDDLGYAVRSGQISPEAAADIRKVQEYVPFWRLQPRTEAEQAALNLTTRQGSGSLSQQTTYKEMKGGAGETEDPLLAFLERHYHLYEEGTKNITANKLAELGGLKGKSAYSDFFRAQEVPVGEAARNDPNFIHFLDQGKHRAMRVSPIIGVAAQNLSAVEFGTFAKLAQQVMRVQRDAFVGVSIPFALMVNQARDSFNLAVTGKGQLRSLGLDRARVNPLTNPVSSVASTAQAMGRRFSPTHQALADRGVTGSRADIWRAQDKHLLSGAAQTASGRFLHSMERALRGAEDLMAFGEEATRGMVWKEVRKAAVADGWTPENADMAADWAARSLTGDFLSGGPHARAWGKFYHLFLTASMAGKRNIGRAFRDDPAGTTKRLFAYVGLPMATLTAYNLSDPARQAVLSDMQESEKYNNLVLVLPGAAKDPKTNRWNGVIKIPLPPEMAAMNSLVSRPMENWASQQDPLVVRDEMEKTFNALSPLPAEVGTLVPQIVRPAVEAGMNKSFFTGKPLTYAKDPRQQFDQRTSETMRLLAPKAGLSPKLTEHLIRGYLGTAAETALWASDKALELSGRAPRPGYVGPRNPAAQITQRWTSTPAGGRRQRMLKRREEMAGGR